MEKDLKAGKEIIKDILIALVLAGIIYLLIEPTIVKETSMQPNFYENDYLIVSKVSYKFSEPKRDDVVVFKSDLLDSKGKKKLLIKRIIGLPGDVITVKDGEVLINGEEEDQSFTRDGYTTGDIENFTVPENSYFCMGDNRVVSLDSRYPEVGAVSKDDLVGKVVFRAYPFNKIKIY